MKFSFLKISTFLFLFNSAVSFAHNPNVPPVLDQYVYKPEHNLVLHPKYVHHEVKLFYYEGCDGNAFIYTNEPMDLNVNSWENVKSSIAVTNGRAMFDNKDYADPIFYKKLCSRFKSDGDYYIFHGAYNKNRVKVFTQKEIEALEKTGERYDIVKLK